MKRIAFIVVLGATFAAAPAYADDAHHKGPAKPGAAAAQDGAPISDGEIRRIDKDAKKITVRHGPLANLDMPAMTMVFQVKDPAMLEQVKAGDKVKFTAEKVNGAITITRIEPAR